MWVGGLAHQPCPWWVEGMEGQGHRLLPMIAHQFVIPGPD